MTTPKEALRIARGYIVDDIKRKPSEYDPAADLRAIDEALASLEGDAVERVARDNYRLVNYLERLPMDQMQIGDNLEFVVKPAYLLADDRDYIVRILATGLEQKGNRGWRHP